MAGRATTCTGTPCIYFFLKGAEMFAFSFNNTSIIDEQSIYPMYHITIFSGGWAQNFLHCFLFLFLWRVRLIFYCSAMILYYVQDDNLQVCMEVNFKYIQNSSLARLLSTAFPK